MVPINKRNSLFNSINLSSNAKTLPSDYLHRIPVPLLSGQVTSLFLGFRICEMNLIIIKLIINTNLIRSLEGLNI